MLYSEASYYDGYHFQHIAAYNEQLRLKRLDKQAKECFNRRLRQRKEPGHEESKGEDEAASAANREDVPRLRTRLYQQV